MALATGRELHRADRLRDGAVNADKLPALNDCHLCNDTGSIDDETNEAATTGVHAPQTSGQFERRQKFGLYAAFGSAKGRKTFHR